jgi:hypothetical protein
MPPTQQFIEILFPEEIQPDDLDVITPASPEAPGRVRLDQARIGPAQPAAPNSAPLLSRTGAKIGFVAAAELLEPPFSSCYWLEDPPTEAEKEESQPT